MKTTILIFTLNEIDGMKIIMPRIHSTWYNQLIIVDGGSTDGTVEYAKEHGYYIFKQEFPGTGGAYREAIKRCDGDIIIILSPDGNSVPEKIPCLVRRIKEGADIVTASRYKSEAYSEDDDIVTSFGNKMFTWLFNKLFKTKVTDSLVMYRAYRRTALESLNIDTWSDSWGTQILARAAKKNLKIVEIPANEPKRIGGVRKMQPLRNGWYELKMMANEYFHK